MIVLSILLSVAPLEIETRTLVDLDSQGKTTTYLVTERVAHSSGFSLMTKNIDKDPEGVSIGRLDYSLTGEPKEMSQEGFWNDRWNVFTTTFGKSGAVQSINGKLTRSKLGAAKFKNPTSLWFWKTHPRVGESVTVDFLAQNTIATFKIQFTYEGDEKMSIAGRKTVLHRVREKPLSAPADVYTIWWYDDKGMGVKRYHKTTEHEYHYELLSWR